MFGGTHVALDGLKRSSHAAKEWRGTCDDLGQKTEPWEATAQSILAAHTRADQESAAAGMAACRAEPDEVHEPMER